MHNEKTGRLGRDHGNLEGKRCPVSNRQEMECEILTQAVDSGENHLIWGGSAALLDSETVPHQRQKLHCERVEVPHRDSTK